MDNYSLSYREVIPDYSYEEEWVDITINTGGPQSTSTLQDIKVSEKAGGYCFRNANLNHNRNRYIYWRTYQDYLELSEVSLDFNLYQNNLRFQFTDSPVISVSITEHERYVVLLVATVCSLHRLEFPHPDVLADGAGSSIGTGSGSSASCNSSSAATSIDFNESQSFSIFRDASPEKARDPSTFYVIDSQTGNPNNPVPHVAITYLAPNGSEAYFALACQSQLFLYVMNNSSGHTVCHELKEYTMMPRLFSNLKGALIGKSDSSDGDHANSLVFSNVNEHIYLLALYRNDQLRMWSTVSLQSVCSISCNRDGSEPRMQGPQTNALRKMSDTSMCAFLSHSNGSEFICIDIVTEPNMGLVRRKVIASPPQDLADFEVTESRIWALWSNIEGEFSVSSFSLGRGTGMNWVSAAMEPPPDRYCVGIERGMDPREVYCSYIFQPGKFERNVILKALFMFRRSNVRCDGKMMNMLMLKEHVCQAVEDEIQNEVKEFEVSDEEYLEIATRLWERFYSCCEQYHLKASQPTGLAVLEPLDSVCVVKKSFFSLLRPCEILEHLMLAGDDVDIGVLLPVHFPDNEQVGEDLANLVSMLALIEKWLPEEVKVDLERKLYQLEMPIKVIGKLTNDILSGDQDREILPRNYQVILRQKLQTIKNLGQAMSLLLDTLRMDNGNPEAMQTHAGVSQSTRFLMSLGTLFGSRIGISCLSETVRQMAVIRFTVCCNLMILQQILIETYSVPMNVLELIRSQYMTDTAIFLQAYYVMMWISDTPVNIALAASLETSIQRLNLLQLSNGSGRIYSNGGKSHCAHLLQVFLNAKGLYTSLALYADNYRMMDGNLCMWQNTLIPLSTIVCQLIWPVSYNFVFGEWLFGSCQHIIIENYVRLLNNWCEWNICSRQFVLAVSLLDCGESQKAYDLFLHSAKGVLKEQFLTEKILKDTPLGERLSNTLMSGNTLPADDIAISNQVVAQYYLKVIQLFEQHNALDRIIALAQVAIGLLDKEDPQLPMFQSIVFNNHLQLEHYEEAYHSLIYNADLSRRKDCLRQLVVTLFQSKRLDLLMHFPYVGLHEEFENIVESRARSQVIENNEIYDFLYAFHVNNGNMRKASAIMYEQAMRFQLESETIESMQKRCSSLLICINALHLIDTRYRWIAKPIIGEEYSPQHMDMDDGAPNKSQVVVLEIKDISRELLHTEALVRLAQHRKDVTSYFHAGPQELAMIMASCGLYTPAIKLLKGFQMPLLPVFDSLTAACGRTADEGPSEAWAWLQENDLADLPHRNKASDMAWGLLQKLVEEHEEDNSTQIRKTVTNKILALNAFVPQWLYNDYKTANVSELLFLFVKHGRLLEAAELANEMLSAMLGAGSEYFSFKHSLNITTPELCLPINTLDILLYGLKANASDDVEYKQAALELEDSLHRYIQTATRTAEDKIQLAFQRQHERQQMNF